MPKKRPLRPFRAFVILDKNATICGDPYRKKGEAAFAAKAMNDKFGLYSIEPIQCTFHSSSK
jgi:hypothetical protein